MAKTIAQKMFLQAGQRLLLVNPPPAYVQRAELPAEVQLAGAGEDELDAIQAFVTTNADLEQVAGLAARLAAGGTIWISYPKGSARITSEVNRDTIRHWAGDHGLSPMTLISVDDDWSAFRFRRSDG